MVYNKPEEGEIMSFENIQDMAIIDQAKAIVDGEHDLIANLANISALIFESFTDINWAGFYLYKEDQLVLGPFQGKIACVRINLDKGVCGHAATIKETVIVKNVHEFPGHIACDSASNSEIVVPIIKNNLLIGVLDIDSPILNRFTAEDQHICEGLVNIIVNQMI